MDVPAPHSSHGGPPLSIRRSVAADVFERVIGINAETTVEQLAGSAGCAGQPTADDSGFISR